MVQYLKKALKHDYVSGWKHTLEKLSVVFDNAYKVDSKEKTEETDWSKKFGRNWYY